MAKVDKSRYKREMKTYIPPKGETKKKFKDPNAPKRPPSAFFLYFSEYGPKIKGERPGLSIGDAAKKLGEMWNNTAADDKQPYEKRSAKLKEKYEKDIAAYRAKGKHDAANNGVVKAAKSKKKKEEEENEEDEEDEEEKDEEDEDEDDDEDEEEDGDDEQCKGGQRLECGRPPSGPSPVWVAAGVSCLGSNTGVRTVTGWPVFQPNGCAVMDADLRPPWLRRAGPDYHYKQASAEGGGGGPRLEDALTHTHTHDLLPQGLASCLRMLSPAPEAQPSSPADARPSVPALAS
ncbi:high mobility group protein B1-like [Pan troglodytes]|uniref:high mobility group protein B1-like n=1 Tax=Pan troglodytes TaxID=9598 RepID=UPI003013A20A